VLHMKHKKDAARGLGMGEQIDRVMPGTVSKSEQ